MEYLQKCGENMNLPKRKHPRLKEYDYSQNGCYFVTVCIKNRERLLGKIDKTKQVILLSTLGLLIKRFILAIDSVYEDVFVDNYVIMPDHIHLLIRIEAKNGNSVQPELQTIIRSFKTMVTKQLGKSIWQTSYYEHVVRNEKDYLNVWNYIEENPYRWLEKE